MKKVTFSLLTGVLMLVTLCMFPLSAHAAETVSVSIPVEIEDGGTAVVISEVNCPLPEQSSIEISDGATENINIDFSVPGDYMYTIQAETKDDLYYSPAYYYASVTVRADGSGELTATTILTRADGIYKPDSCRFLIAEAPTDSTDNTENPDATHSDTPTQPSKNPPTSRPKTGDDSMLDIYLLICIAAAGGLFALSVVYSVSTERLIGKK